jgi:hypothetical protein
MILASHGIIASSILQVDPDWLAYYNRVIAAGGSLTTTEQNATKTLVADLKSAGIWSGMKAIYPMVGASAAACAQNLKSASFTGTFTSGWTFASTGVTPNGSSAYMNTGLVTNTNLSLNSAHLSYYSRTNTTTPDAFDMGSSATNAEIYLCYKAFGNQYVAVNSNGSTYNALANTLNLLQINRVNSTQVKVYKNGSTHQTISLNSNSINSLNNYIGCMNVGGTPLYFTARQCAFASIGDGLTDTQAGDFYTAVQAFQTTLSRNV